MKCDQCSRLNGRTYAMFKTENGRNRFVEETTLCPVCKQDMEDRRPVRFEKRRG